MTRKQPGPASMTRAEALALLYDEDVRNLIPDGYQQALANKRVDAALARRVDRALDSYLSERVFPRRRVPWTATSRGMRARLLTMPDNPHLEQDLETVRDVLGLVGWSITSSVDDPTVAEIRGILADPSQAEAVVARDACGHWLNMHRLAYAGNADDGHLRPLDAEAIGHAHRAAALSWTPGSSAPTWFRSVAAAGPSPVDTAVASVIHRHRLPAGPSVEWRITCALLMHDRQELRGASLAQVMMELGSAAADRPDPGQFSLTIGGLDEFITKDVWDELWTWVAWRQTLLLEQRGQQPAGRRGVDVDRLVALAPLYRIRVLEELSIDRAFEKFLTQSPSDVGALDNATVRRTVKDLAALLTPEG